jgi:hypothetical protein
MKVYVCGQFLSAKVSEFEGKKNRVVNLLSGDDTVRITFSDDSTIPMFESCQKLKRLDEVQVCCSLRQYKENLYFNALKE